MPDGSVVEVLADGSTPPLESRTDWDRVDAMSDADIERAIAEDPDAAPLLDEAWFKAARRGRTQRRERASVRLDPDVVHWFKAQGPGYEARISAVLRAFIEAHERAE